MKKLTSILLALMLILTITFSAFATVYTEKYFHYTISDESITITDYFGHEDTVTVPAMIAGIPVNTIASGAFTESGIKVLNLPDTITTIDNGAIDSGVVVNYNSNLPPDEQTRPQPNPPQQDPPQQDFPQINPTLPDFTQPDFPGIVVNPIPSPPQDDIGDIDIPEDDITIIDEDIPDDVVIIDESNDGDNKEPEQTKRNEPQSTKPTQSEERKPKPSQTKQPEQPAVTTSTESTYSVEVGEIELDFDETEPVTTVITEEEPSHTEETEAVVTTVSTDSTNSTNSTDSTEEASEAVTEPKPEKSKSSKPILAVAAAVVVAAALALGGFIIWNKKKSKQ